MKSQLAEMVDIGQYTTFNLGGKAKYFAIATLATDLPELINLATKHNVRPFVLGGGSNIIVSDGELDILAIKIEIPGINIVEESDDYALVKVGAGVIWDDLVKWSVEKNLTGIEALSAIPGTCGAAPVQNIGAYGTEFKDVCANVSVYDTQTKTFSNFNNDNCEFSYRHSIFKQQPGRYIVTSITIELSKKAPSVPNYPGVKEWLAEHKITSPALADIRQAITEIRWSKLPRPSEIPNVGSFFTNPIVDKKTLNTILKNNPSAPHFEVGTNLFKLSAGWLIDQADLKGKDFGKIKTYQNNALVLINPRSTSSGQATASFAEVIAARDEIVKIVKEKFGVTIEMEPEIVE